MEKYNSGTKTVFVYDAFGKLAADYSTTVQTPACVTCYVSSDHLGTARLITDGAANVVARHDYLPFGEEVQSNAYGRDSHWGPYNDSINQKFTAQERDSESGLDFFQARYYSSALGRFTRPDPANAGAVLTNPQSWNGYSYVIGNPLALYDPSGLDDIPVVCGSDSGPQVGTCQSGTANCTFVSSCSTSQQLPTAVAPSLDGLSLPTISIAGGSSDTSMDDLGAGVINLLGQNTDAQYSFMGAFAAGSALAGAGGAFAPSLVSGTVGLAARAIGWAQGTYGAGTGIVIGAFDAVNRYTDVARSIGANYYSIPDPAWRVLNNFGQAWTANQAFLDASINRGQQVFLSSNPLEAVNYYAMELEYLTARGVGPAQWEVVPFPIRQISTMFSLK